MLGEAEEEDQFKPLSQGRVAPKRRFRMAVLIEGISVVIRADSIIEKFPGGWDAFKEIVPNNTLCADNEIVRVGFMSPQDVELFVEKLEKSGLEFLLDGEAIDIAVADQMRGLTSKCSWLEFGHLNMQDDGPKVSACRIIGSETMELVTPPNWEYENSLSASFAFVPSEHIEKGMKYLRHEKGLDVYLNPITGKETYVARTGES